MHLGAIVNRLLADVEARFEREDAAHDLDRLRGMLADIGAELDAAKAEGDLDAIAQLTVLEYLVQRDLSQKENPHA